jgi:hypothetical protein
MQNWFVYYKLDPEAARELEPSIRAMQQALHAETGVRPRLMSRADGQGKTTTLLEVYERIAEPAEFEAALASALARSDLPAALSAQRRTERFVER